MPSASSPTEGLAVDKARRLEVEAFGGGIIGFRLPEEAADGDAAETEGPAKAVKPRRKAATG
jgi:hypothetical protein